MKRLFQAYLTAKSSIGLGWPDFAEELLRFQRGVLVTDLNTKRLVAVRTKIKSPAKPRLARLLDGLQLFISATEYS